jgi:hypothetical protein
VLISNEVVEHAKLQRIVSLSKYATVSLCVDNLQVIEGYLIHRYVNNISFIVLIVFNFEQKKKLTEEFVLFCFVLLIE